MQVEFLNVLKNELISVCLRCRKLDVSSFIDIQNIGHYW